MDMRLELVASQLYPQLTSFPLNNLTCPEENSNVDNKVYYPKDLKNWLYSKFIVKKYMEDEQERNQGNGIKNYSLILVVGPRNLDIKLFVNPLLQSLCPIECCFMTYR